mgnify:CR=1 FL=1
MINKKEITNRFIKYITIDTESDPNNPAFPSTEKQWDLAKLLVEELKQIGMQDVDLDDNCYIMATLPSNVDFHVPTIGFIAHIDTSPDFTGANVNPQIIENYDEEKDFIKYKSEKNFSSLLINEKELAIFYPNDAHQPCIKDEKSELIYKAVVKIPLI